MTENLKSVLQNCQTIINALIVGGGISYHPASMVELSGAVAVELADIERLLTPIQPDNEPAPEKLDDESKDSPIAG